jgi:hypothetical protein
LRWVTAIDPLKYRLRDVKFRRHAFARRSSASIRSEKMGLDRQPEEALVRAAHHFPSAFLDSLAVSAVFPCDFKTEPT